MGVVYFCLHSNSQHPEKKILRFGFLRVFKRIKIKAPETAAAAEWVL